MDSMDANEREGHAADQPQERLPYSAPVLTVHGDLDELTANVGTIATDGLTGSRLI